MAVAVGQRCVVRIQITDINLRNAKEILATIVSPQGEEKCQDISFDEVSGLVYATVDVNSAGNWSMWLNVRFANEVLYTPVFVFAEVGGDAMPCDAPYIVDVEVAGESVSVTPPKIDVDAVTREEFEQLSKDVAGKVDKVEGKGLSTNDFTNEYKQKVDEAFERQNTDNNYTDADKALVQTIPNLATKNEVNTVQKSTIEAIKGVRTELRAKADTNGYYPSMSVGMADNLVGRGDVQDAQINFRPSAGADNITDGAARIERIKGNSVVWNQLVNTDSTSVELVAKRTYFTDIDGEHSVRIISATTTIEAQSGRDKVVNLTQMFGVGNEPTTVEEYRQRKPMNIEDEFAYNAGTLVDMKVDSLISTSDNAYDYVKGYARVMGGQTYDCSYGSAFVEKVYFSTDKDNIVAEENAMTSENGKYTFPSDGYVVPYTTDGDKREYCVCLQHTYTKPHPAYQQVVKDLSFIGKAFPNGMRSAGSVYDEIRYNRTTQKWEKVTRVGKASGLTFISGGTNLFATRIADMKNPTTHNERMDGVRTNKYTLSTSSTTTSAGDKTILRFPSTNNIYIKDTSYSLVAEFNAANQDLVIYYELEKPIVEEIDLSPNFNLDYFAWDFGTEEAIASVPSAPFRADINYEPNAVDDLRWAVSEIRSLKAQIAQMSTSVTNLTE